MTAGAASPAEGGGEVAAPLVDTHCHLVLLEERGLLDEALLSAASAGVEQVVTVGLDVDDSDRNRVVAERRPGVFFTVGWHPHTPVVPDAAQMAALSELLSHPRAVAVGEIGLDHYWRPGYHEVPPEVQLRSLRAMLELAVQHGKPVVVHDRDAHEEVMAALEEGLRAWRPARPAGHGRDARGVLHCFSGDAALARRARAAGMVCSFAGTVTYPRSEGVQEAARALDGDGLVVETDAPFLAPVPHRGRPNLPGYVADTARVVAALRGEPMGAVARRTTDNARRLFALEAPGAADRIGGA